MIEESEIAGFEPSIQARIREKIAKQVSLGYKLQHLILRSDGSVLYDREAVTFDAEVEAFSESRPQRAR
jgi:hypothetical protein